jgi:hypothetical protein
MQSNICIQTSKVLVGVQKNNPNTNTKMAIDGYSSHCTRMMMTKSLPLGSSSESTDDVIWQTGVQKPLVWPADFKAACIEQVHN